MLLIIGFKSSRVLIADSSGQAVQDLSCRQILDQLQKPLDAETAETSSLLRFQLQLAHDLQLEFERLKTSSNELQAALEAAVSAAKQAEVMLVRANVVDC